MAQSEQAGLLAAERDKLDTIEPAYFVDADTAVRAMTEV